MRVVTEALSSLKSPSSAPVCALGHLPPQGGRLWGRSNREKFGALWDVWIHILGIGAECACWGGGRSGCTGPTREGVGVCPLIRPFGPPSPRGEGFWGEPPHSPLKGKDFGRLIAAPTERNPLGRAGEGTRPYSVFTNGSTYRKRDRSGTCPLKRRGEAELRTKFLCLLSFSKKGGDPAPPRRVRFLI